MSFFKKFDLGNGHWAKFCLAVKLGKRFLTGLRGWLQQKEKPFPLFLNTVITNAPNAKVSSTDGFPARLFLNKDGVRGFSCPKEIILSVKDNGRPRKFHCRWAKEGEEQNGVSVFKVKAWEERPQEKRKPLNETMAEALKTALKQANGNRRKKPADELEQQKRARIKRAKKNPSAEEINLNALKGASLKQAADLIH